MIVLAVIAYFHHAMSETGARLEPEKLLQNKGVVACTLLTAIAAVWLLHAHKTGTFEVRDALKLMQPRW
jgi:hypothetical protein